MIRCLGELAALARKGRIPNDLVVTDLASVKADVEDVRVRPADGEAVRFAGPPAADDGERR